MSIPNSILSYLISKKVKSHLVTVTIGTDRIAWKIAKFESAVNSAAVYQGISYTYMASYEEQEGLCNLHYQLFLSNEGQLQEYEAIVKKFAAKKFPLLKGDDQVQIESDRDNIDIYDYVTKRHHPKISTFAMKKSVKKIQVRWKRGYKKWFAKNCHSNNI